MTIETGRTTIRQLRATSSDRDPFAYQLRLGSMLSSADLHPPGVSASAIICIRTLHAPPLPTQALRYGGGRPPLWWEERVRTLIKHALQQASHPLHDTVPPDCEAVIFADRAELLACLASDWCATGDTSDRWWWQSLFRTGAIEQYLIPAWLETPEYIPSALLHLASARKATAFVRRLPANDVRTLLHSLIRSFALPELQTVLAAAFSAQPFSSATLLQEYEHAPATSETSNTSDTSDTSDTIDTLEIAETSETTETSSATNLPDGYGLFDKQGSVEADVSHPTIMKLSEGEKPLRRGGSGVDAERGPLWSPVDGTCEPVPDPTHGRPQGSPPLRMFDAPLPLMPRGANLSYPSPIDWPVPLADTSSPTYLPDEYSQAPVRADVSCSSPHPACTLPGGQGIAGNHRPIPLTNTSTPTIDEQTSQATPLAQSPWLPWVPESTEHDLSPEQQALLGISFMLTRAPATVRTASFAQSINYWYGTDRHTAPQCPTSTPTSTPGDLPIPPPPRVPVKGTLSGGQVTPTMDDETSTSSSVHSRGTPRGYPGAGVAYPTAGLAYPDFAMQIETAYGGIFYLINLALFLNLYGDFTTPLQPGIALPIWDFVALLGQQMLGEHIVADPVWPLLAQLTGRPVEELPGRYFEPPEHWHIPPAWLSAFPGEAAWHWSIENGRLRVLHPAQFLLLDVPLDTNNPIAQLKHELNSYANVYSQDMPPLHYTPTSLLTAATLLPCGRVAVDNLDDTLPPSLQRWLHWLMPYVYARLQRALGLAETEDASSKLCKHDASIAMTTTHIRITLSLAELPIEIRIAGLDRDPGWVPAAGRFIAFHFQ